MSRFWPIFVSCSSSDSLVLRALDILFWSASFFGISGALAQSLQVLPEGVEVAFLGHLECKAMFSQGRWRDWNHRAWIFSCHWVESGAMPGCADAAPRWISLPTSAQEKGWRRGWVSPVWLWRQVAPSAVPPCEVGVSIPPHPPPFWLCWVSPFWVLWPMPFLSVCLFVCLLVYAHWWFQVSGLSGTHMRHIGDKRTHHIISPEVLRHLTSPPLLSSFQNPLFLSVGLFPGYLVAFLGGVAEEG